MHHLTQTGPPDSLSLLGNRESGHGTRAVGEIADQGKSHVPATVGESGGPLPLVIASHVRLCRHSLSAPSGPYPRYLPCAVVQGREVPSYGTAGHAGGVTSTPELEKQGNEAVCLVWLPDRP